MEDNAVIPIDRTQVPVEYDELRDSINRILTDLGPTPEQPKGPFGDIIESAADGLRRQGRTAQQDAERTVARRCTTLNEGRGDFFGVIKSLALFVNALYQSDQQFVALNNDLADVHQLVHQHRPRGRQRAAAISTSCCRPPASSSTRTARC